MGNCCTVEGAIDHWIYVKTGDHKDPKTNVKLYTVLYDKKGNRSPEIPLILSFPNEFERGYSEVFQAPPLGTGFDDVDRIELWREVATDVQAPVQDWYCEVIIINDRRFDRWFHFPVQRWVKPNHRYKVMLYDCLLPQFDPNTDQRQSELEEKREVYQYGQTAIDLPVQIRLLPADEQFSDEYKWDLITSKEQYIRNAQMPIQLHRQQPEYWDDLEQLIDFYCDGWFPEPVGVVRWSNDICFGAQRIVGCNPTQIRACTSLPENMGVTAEMLKPYLEGWTLKQIIGAKRLFYVDLSILNDLPTRDGLPICSPIALFVVNGEKRLVPIAIQLFKDIAPNNPVFLPNDNPFTWLLAKMWFNHADASVHMALSHFAFTHLLMEGVYISIQRHLSPSHPVYKMLVPHFLFLLSINARGLDQLLSPNGWVDHVTSLGREGMFELIRRGIADWRIDVHGNFPKELESRGVLDIRILPNYAYRDDGLLLHKAIDMYVSKILRNHYNSSEKLQQDSEIQNWAAELAVGKDDGGVGINGLPNGGQFKTLSDVALVCVSLIFNCTVQHAAVNFSQYEEYAFPPNYPLLLHGEPPTDKLPKTEEDIVDILPDKLTTLDTMAIMKLWSSRGPKSLGEWDFKFQYDPVALQAEKEFQQELLRISSIIKQRNEERDDFYKYPYLEPDLIPNSISI